MGRCNPNNFSDKENEIFDLMTEREEIVKQLREAQDEVERLKALKAQYSIKAICHKLGVKHWQVIKVWY